MTYSNISIYIIEFLILALTIFLMVKKSKLPKTTEQKLDMLILHTILLTVIVRIIFYVQNISNTCNNFSLDIINIVVITLVLLSIKHRLNLWNKQ